VKERIVLMFAYHFLPENGIGGARPYRFYKYLSRMGYRCHVITADQTNCRSRDFEYVADPFITRPGQGIGWHTARAIRKFFLPGATGLQWSRKAYQAARTFLLTNPNSEVTIVSTFPPLGTHLAAFQLVRIQKLPWVADFRDPLANCPGFNLSQLQQKVSRRLERTFFKTADVVIANTDTMENRWKAAYPDRSDRIYLIWNGFDPENRIHAEPLPQRDYKLVSHLGGLFGGRNITPLLQSISRLIEKGRLSAAGIRILLVGYAGSDSLPGSEFLDQARTHGWLEVVSTPVTHPEALHIAQTSDGLLLVQPHSTLQVPGKLFEYLQVGRPILALIPRDTPIERILKQSGIAYRCAYAGSSPQEMDTAVESFFSLDTTPARSSVWFESTFDGEKQTQILERLIRSVHGHEPQKL
jgi:glycosyltransferase involved in cell wall biosynthesis